ncbi:hypothetical protein CKAH01_08397 [Colletotrichum kahawae]|uniref:Uncharacterized protein n=1 Tax=Colletotrichum kahawae TaxID=34407 RepID=A0AAD9Y2R8_COLKA|nr:hypothetical protein CKAH01_08397 [Colletotrichum kahawae]
MALETSVTAVLHVAFWAADFTDAAKQQLQPQGDAGDRRSALKFHHGPFPTLGELDDSSAICDAEPIRRLVGCPTDGH